MPLEIVTVDGVHFTHQPYEPLPLEPDHVRIRVEFAAPKHGTELHSLGGSAFNRKRWDSELRMFLPADPPTELTPPPPAPRRVGNMVVGTVVELGDGVTRWAPGDRVFGYGPIREVHQLPESKLFPLGNLTEADAVCADPAHVAFVAVRDGNVRIGDDVAVYGLGAIGLLTVQMARAAGARHVFAVDPIALRREHALAHGADAAFDPTVCDAALEIKLATGKKGVDIALETSGNGRALHDSVRCIRQCGTVVHVPWGPKDASALQLDEEFHLNRPTLVGSQAVWDNADRSHPLWDRDRAQEAAIDLFRRGLITGEGIVTPIVSFQEAPELLPELMRSAERSIKAGVRFES
jgi:threonine dehydrogenase-like Zn-dependent dehydrogenase